VEVGLEEIRQQIEVAGRSALPASVLAKACDYTLGLWPRLICFLEHPELELSNNWAENSMRPIALGRKNWLHVGSAQAGPKNRRHPIDNRKLPPTQDPQSTIISATCCPAWLMLRFSASPN